MTEDHAACAESRVAMETIAIQHVILQSLLAQASAETRARCLEDAQRFIEGMGEKARPGLRMAFTVFRDSLPNP